MFVITFLNAAEYEQIYILYIYIYNTYMEYIIIISLLFYKIIIIIIRFI